MKALNFTGSRRTIMRAIGAFGLGPAAQKAAGIHAALTATVARAVLPDVEAGFSEMVGGDGTDRHISRAEKRLGSTVFKLLSRQNEERDISEQLRRTAYSMQLDPDIAALRACSPVFLRHLQHKRLQEEMERKKAIEYSLWPPDWMT